MNKLFYILFMVLPSSRQEGCLIHPTRSDDFPFSFPLTFWGNTDELVYPPWPLDSYFTYDLVLSPGDEISITCPDGSFTNFDTKLIRAFCSYESELESNNQTLDFDTLQCVSERPPGQIIPQTNCAQNSTMLEISTQVNLEALIFFPLANICFDVVNRNAHYVQYKLTKYIIYKTDYVHDRLEEDNIYNLETSLDEIYNFTNQLQTLNSLVGLDENSTKYVLEDRVLGRTLLMPNLLADTEHFVYQIPQRALLRYVNSAPVWEFIDYGNWYSVLLGIIQCTQQKETDLQIFSGVFGVTTLPHEETGKEVDLFLYVSEKGQKAIPVPAVIWKVVYDEQEKSAIVLLVVNNPFRVKPEEIICKDISLSVSVSWLMWSKNNVTLGYSYACTYEDFRKRVPDLPELDVEKILY